ncbi:hypothetical protein ElyMa_000482400 [Elysia marginata]|uniref:LolA-like domain-containing protein n=1 Tax=Elysia marginata TaxID=1093978 RepID=A0AAV4FSV7_9GAST|nr:hypothetical protein ElyMa_000482400 [Elysia marginata]
MKPNRANPALSNTPFLLIISTAAIFLGHADALPPWFPPPSVCNSTHTPSAYDGPAPPLPELPVQYSLRVEANILQKRWTTEVEEHYDSINQRASLAVSFNGSTVYSIFNFKSEERYDIYPNGSCIASRAGVDYFGFVKMTKGPKGQRPAMATINQVFKFGKGYNQTYVGKDTVRGIPVNHWTSCRVGHNCPSHLVEWTRWGAKFQLDFYFADPDFISASGGHQIPVRIVLNGTANNVGRGQESVEGRHRFEHMYEFVSVRPGPPRDADVFQVPPGVFCQGRRDTKPMPELPERFEMNTEIVVPDSGMHPRQNYLRYDWPHRLLETGMRMAVPQGFSLGGAHNKYKGNGQGGSAPGAPGGSGASGGTAAGSGGRGKPPSKDSDDDALRLMSISKVQDFNTGIVYVLDKMKMTCSAHVMPQATFQLGMSHGANLFHPAIRQTNTANGFTYQGQTSLRQMLVDTWALEENGMTQELYFLVERDRSMMRPPNSKPKPPHATSPQHKSTAGKPTVNHKSYPMLVGMYLKNSTATTAKSMASIFREVFQPDAMQWTGLATTPGPASSAHAAQMHPGMGRPMGDQLAFGIQLERALEQRLSHKLVHIYNYQPIHTESSNFQVSLCYPDDQVSQVMLAIRTSYDDDVLQSFAAFSNNLRQAIAKEAGISLLQVSNLVPMPVPQVGANMTTVTFSLLGTPVASARGQIGLIQAKRNLRAAIKSGIVFSVEYSTQSKWFIVDKDLVFIDYDTMRLDNPPGKKPGSQGNPSAAGNKIKDKLTSAGALGASDDGSSGGDGGYSGGAVAGIAIAMLAIGIAAGLGAAYFFLRRRRCDDSSVPYQMTS